MTSALETLEKCEQEAAELQKKVAVYEEISSLVSSIPNLLKADQIFVGYKKKIEELKLIMKQNQKTLKQIEVSLKCFKIEVSQTAANKVNLKEEQNDLIRTIEVKKFQVHTKRECCELVKQLNQTFIKETEVIDQIIEKTKEEIKNIKKLSFSNYSTVEATCDSFESLKKGLLEESFEFVESRCKEIINQKLEAFEKELTQEILSLDSLINK